jgi:putative ABC transport system permease protein
LSQYLCQILGLTLLNVPLTHTFPLSGLLLWLVLVIILAAIASILPARNASRLSVRETLTYE